MRRLDARSEQRAHFAGQLLLQRAKAEARAGEWIRSRAKNGLEIAWRVEDGVEKIGIRRPDQLPFEDDLRFLVETLHHEFDGLAVVEKLQKGEAILLAIRQQGCDRCHWPIDPDAMLKASTVCRACTDPKLTRCYDCPRVIPYDPTFSPNRCQGCAIRAGREQDNRRRQKEALRNAR